MKSETEIRERLNEEPKPLGYYVRCKRCNQRQVNSYTFLGRCECGCTEWVLNDE